MISAQRCRSTFLLASLVLILPEAGFASSLQADRQYGPSPFAEKQPFTGDITYEFDSVVNRTTATYRASLAKRDLLHRLFFPPPDVHTIIASYEYPGRLAAHVPDSVRIVFESDEYVTTALGSRHPLEVEREMSIRLGDSVIMRSVSMVARTELDSSPAWPAARVMSARMQQQIQLPKAQQVHISRKATTWVSLCEFLALTGHHEMRGTVAGLGFSADREVLAGLKLFAAEMPHDGNDRRFVDCGVK